MTMTTPDRDGRNLLIVAYYFPPISASGCMRPLAFCRHLEQFGWRAQVLTTDPASLHPPLEVDGGLVENIPASVRVHRVPHTGALQTAIRVRDTMFRKSPRERNGHGGSPSETSPQRPSKVREWVGHTKEVLLEHLYAFPDQHVSWLRPAVRAAVAIGRRDRIDAVFATGSPWTGLVVGMKTARKLGVPLIVDFRDPWTRNPYGTWREPSLLTRAQALERELCSTASWVIANTDELKAQFAEDYPQLRDRLVTITNGFDVSRQQASWATARRDAGTEPIEVWHFGSVYGKRDPLPILSALRHLHERDQRVDATRIRLRFVGRWVVSDPEGNRQAEWLEARGLLVREPQMAHEQCLEQMHRADALLVIQPSSPLQVPGKIYEYVGTGRPVLVLGGEGATAALVEKYALGRCCANRIDAVTNVLSDLVHGRPLQTPTMNAWQRFDYRELTAQLARCLDAAVDGHRLTGMAFEKTRYT